MRISSCGGMTSFDLHAVHVGIQVHVHAHTSTCSPASYVTMLFSCPRSVGEGSFGRVLQAKAEGIVPDMPDKNVVAVKTTKGT